MRSTFLRQRMSGIYRATAAQRLAGHAWRFAAREDGSLILFGVYVFLIILIFGGIGIDLMRFERDRANLQYTMDRAVLAAADLDQPLDPQAVVRDYLSKAGMSDFLTNVTVDEGMSYRTVSASASTTVETQFMRMSGVDTLVAPAASTAEERIDGVEISLVLDVSGSMNSNNKLSNLKVAAKDFVDEMVDNTEDGNMSMSIVPYATQVSATDEFMAQFNASNEHGYSNCVNFDAADFNTTAISTTAGLERTMHFDVFTDYPWGTGGYEGRPSGSLVPFPICEDDDAREMVVLQKDRTELKTFINNLTAKGNTSIDVGMKWGTALLDPSLKPAITGMVGLGEVPADFADRPHTYSSGETLKVIVLMTDGQNTRQNFLPDEFHNGPTDVWWNEEAQVYSVNAGADVYDRDGDGDRTEDIYYWVQQAKWADHAYGDSEPYTETQCVSYWWGTCWAYEDVLVEEAGTPVPLSMGDLFAFTTPKEIADVIFAPVMGSTAARNKWYYGTDNTYVDSTPKNARTKAICDAAKAEGIIVFTIGFEAPAGGLAVLKDCASSDSHFFDVNGLEISDAFSSIASSIRKLRLTQ